ncbi:MAG TPA: DUF2817 domain-containing protein [Verrucomicrobiae bacterium]|nr:DUF2817 domain-containing protein [Verrucomicrobiae bacterium]
MHTNVTKTPLLLLTRTGSTKSRIARGMGKLVAVAKRWVTFNNLALVTGLCVTAATLFYAAAFLWPRSVVFSYATDTCLAQPVLFPRLVSQTKNAHYSAAAQPSLSVAGYPLYSHSTCFSPLAAPQENHTNTVTLHAAAFKKQIRVTTNTFPAVMNQAALEKPIPVQEPLDLQLTEYDRIFDYQLQAGDRKVACNKQDTSLKCDVTQMGLSQSAKYDFTLERQYKGQAAGTLFTRTLSTVQSVIVVGSSIPHTYIVYHAPIELVLTLNRPAVSVQGVHLYQVAGQRQEIPTTASVSGTTLTVRFGQPLARSAQFTVSIDTIKAEDGGSLTAPFTQDFKTSGGPKVLGTNIGSYKVSTSGSITLTFDSALSATQATNNFIRLEAGGTAVAAGVQVRGNTAVITPDTPLPRCAALTIKVVDGLQNSYGISGGSAWQFKSRTICQSVFSIGTSVQGRGITAYSFGSGPSKVVFVGGTHGDEKSSSIILSRWVDYLEASGAIPGGRTIVIVPTLNPDGYAVNRRTNAHNVDLNRNFPANNWKSGVAMPDKSFNPSGGGSAPLSEPESAALASYVTGASLVLTYHAVAGVVMPNGSVNSDSLAHLYDQKSNVGYAASSATGELFEYDTTGALEDWLHDKRGIPALLIELWTKTGNEYASHQAAMQAVIQ